METVTVPVPMGTFLCILGDEALHNRLRNMGTNLHIPAESLLEVLRSPTAFKTLFALPNFRDQLLRSGSLVSDMLRDRHISKNIQEHDDDLWAFLWHLKETESNERVETRPSTKRQPNTWIRSLSQGGDARCKVGDALVNNEGGSMAVTSESIKADAETSMGKLMIGSKQSPSVELSSRSEAGDATTSVDSVIMGSSHTRTYGDRSIVGSGIAMSGQTHIANGVYFYGRPEPDDFQVPKTKQANHRKTKAASCGAKIDEELCSYLTNTNATSRKELDEEDQQLIDLLTDDLAKKTTLVSTAMSSKGKAVFKSKKMNIDLEDSEQHVLAVAKSRDSDAIVSIEELNIKTSKPQPVHKTYNIEKVVGALYVENSISSSFSNCQGNMRATETNVEQGPEGEDEEEHKSSNESTNEDNENEKSNSTEQQ